MAVVTSLKIFALVFAFAGFCRVAAQVQPAKVDAKPVAVKLLEIGKVPDRRFTATLSELLKSLDTAEWNAYSPEVEMLVFCYGSAVDIAKQKKLFLRGFSKARLHHAIITVVEGGPCLPTQTVFWKRPRLAPLPTVCPE